MLETVQSSLTLMYLATFALRVFWTQQCSLHLLISFHIMSSMPEQGPEIFETLWNHDKSSLLDPLQHLNNSSTTQQELSNLQPLRPARPNSSYNQSVLLAASFSSIVLPVCPSIDPIFRFHSASHISPFLFIPLHLFCPAARRLWSLHFDMTESCGSSDALQLGGTGVESMKRKMEGRWKKQSSLLRVCGFPEGGATCRICTLWS